MDQATPAQTVGNQFVSQYYTVLHSSPKHLHRFYSDRSTLTYADVIPEGDSITQNLKTATGQKMIHETVMNLGYEDTMTEIYSVDSQYSKDGGVVVQVTGALQAKGKDNKRPFVQTFFLAVQEKGYFVLNDIFRYLVPPGLISGILADDDEEGTETADATTGAKEPTTSTSSTSLAGDMAGRLTISDKDPSSPSSTSNKKESSTVTSPAIAGKDAPTTTITTTTFQELKRQSSGPSAVPAAPGVSVPFTALVPGEVGGGTTGVNGVSIVYGAHSPPRRIVTTGTVNDAKPTSSSSSVPPPPDQGVGTSGPPSSSRQSSPGGDVDDSTSPKHASGGTTTTATTTTTRRPPPPPPRHDPGSSAVSSIKSLDSPGPDSMEPPPTEGIFIRDIPQAVTLDHLAEALSQYGPIVPASLSLKTQQNRDSYAFVDYQNAEDAAECLAHGMEFFGRKVTVETKRPHIFKTSGGPGGGGGGMRHAMNSNAMNNSLGGSSIGSVHMQQYPTSPHAVSYQQHQYQQYQTNQHNARGGGGSVANGGNVGLGAPSGYNTNRHIGNNGQGQRMVGGGGVGGTNGVGNVGVGGGATMQNYPRNAMSLQSAAAYSMATGYTPVMMYNPAMPGMTFVQMQPNHQTAAMMMDSGSGGVGLAGGMDTVGGGGYVNAASMQMNRGGRGSAGGNIGGNGRYDSGTGGRGGVGGGGGRGGSRGSSDQQHSPYARGAGLGQSMPYV